MEDISTQKKKLELLYSGNCHSKLGDNQSSTSKGFSYFIWWFNFFPNPSPLLYSFQILSPIQSELIHSVKSLNVVHHLKSMYRAQQKMYGRQILRSFAESSGNRKRLPWKSKKRGCEKAKKIIVNFPPTPDLCSSFVSVYQLKSVQLIPGVALRLNDAS